jgi:hypothetical protein
MPTSNEILAQAALIANEAKTVAVAWHVVLWILVAALAFGWRPSARTVGRWLALPLASVALVGLAYRSPFNALVFLMLAVGMFVLAPKRRAFAVTRAPPIVAGVGIAMVAFGAIYPHFLQASSIFEYAYASPIGVVPCPTLYVVIGFALLADGGLTRAGAATLAGAGLFFGLYGMVVLRVAIDIGLIAGAFALGSLAFVRSGQGVRS